MTARRSRRGYRANVAVRAVTAVAGGYALAALAAFAGARAWPTDRLQATVAATIAAFLLIPASAVYAFLAASPRRALGGILAACGVLAAAGMLLGPRP